MMVCRFFYYYLLNTHTQKRKPHDPRPIQHSPSVYPLHLLFAAPLARVAHHGCRTPFPFPFFSASTFLCATARDALELLGLLLLGQVHRLARAGRLGLRALERAEAVGDIRALAAEAAAAT